MSHALGGKSGQADWEAIAELLQDPGIVRIVTVLDISHLSILELLEYGLTRRDVDHALIVGVIEMNRRTLPSMEVTTIEGMFVSGEVYFQQLLSSKVHLTKLGEFLLGCIKGCETEQEILEKARERFGSGAFFPPAHPQRPG
jgi:hypothetical protein